MTRPVRELVPAFIRNIEPYVPGKPIEDVERELGMRCVKLASNENPLGPSPLAIAASIQALAEANRYPDGGGYYLRKKLSERMGVSLDQVILGAGSTDLIELVAKTLLHSDDSGITSHGSFPMYYIAVRATGARLVEVPQKNYRIDLDGMARAVEPCSKLIYLANPNNPTGTLFTAGEFEKFLDRIQKDVLVVLDEAYFDYVERADYSRSIEMVRQGRNVLVLRTFSKVYGLAGLRIGYGVGPVELLEELNKLRLPFNTSIGAQAAALAALDDFDHVKRSVESNRAGLAQLARGLEEMNVNFVPSVGNFVLVELNGEAESVTQELMKQGVIVRPMRWMGFPSAIRVTVGTADD
ncbi:MAG: histidinol-phosphate transaminase, partial [Candidatus Acidiferrales bacterium]